MQRLENETQLDFMRRIVYSRLVDRTIDTPYEELSEALFGEGNCFNESEVRKRCYGMLRLFEVIDQQDTNIKNRILCLSDFHVPFQLPVQTFVKYRNSIDTLILNGDIIDLAQISKFKMVKRNTPMDDIILARQYLIDLINYLNPKKVIANAGNHEWRFYRYLDKMLDNDLCELLPKTPLDLIFDDGFNHYNHVQHTKVWYEPLSEVFQDIEITYTGTWYNQLGDTLFVHPNAFNSGTLKTTERAMDYFLHEGMSFAQLIMSHTHRCASSNVGGISLYESGCCCDVVTNNYRDGFLISTQKEGYIYINQDEDGNTIKDLTKLVVLN